MLPRSRSVPASPHTVLPYELATPLSIEKARADHVRQHFDRVAELFKEYRRMLVRWLMKHFEIEEAIAEDAVQDAFVNLLRRDDVHFTKPVSLLLTYAKTAYRVAMQQRCTRRWRRFSDYQREDWGESRAARTQQPYQIAEYRELDSRAREAIGQASEDLRHGITAKLYDPEKRRVGHRSARRLKRALANLRGKFKDVRPANKPYRMKLTGKLNRRDFVVWCVEADRPFDTIPEAAAFVGKRRNTVMAALLEPARTAGGYHFEYRPRPERREISPQHREAILKAIDASLSARAERAAVTA